jgi:hypothetical protein
MHPRRLLLWLAAASLAAGPARLAAQRDTRDRYYPRIDYGAMQDRIRASVDRAMERSTRAVERSTRLSEMAAERATSRAVSRVRFDLNERRDVFDRDTFDRRMDRMRERMDRQRDRIRDRMSNRMRTRSFRW